MEIPAAIKPYSMAVAPDSSARNWRHFASIVANVDLGGKASVNTIPCKRFRSGIFDVPDIATGIATGLPSTGRYGAGARVGERSEKANEMGLIEIGAE